MSEARAALGKAQMFRREYELTAANGRGVIGVDQDSPYSAIGHAPGSGTLSGLPMVSGHVNREGISELSRPVADRGEHLRRLRRDEWRVGEEWVRPRRFPW